MNKIVTTVIFCFLTCIAFGQKVKEVKWSFSSRKKADKSYEIILSATLQKPWHIYSQLTPDGGPLPTKITFSSNPLLVVSGDAKEAGKLQLNHDKAFGVDVKYFSDKVEFVQAVKLKGPVKTTVRGDIEYMICNDTKCLPPVKQSFDIKLQ